MTTTLFYILLYIVGLICVLPLSRKIPLWILASTGFLWGKLIWIFCSAITLFLGMTFNITNMLILLAIVVIGAVWLNISYKTWKLTPTQYLSIILGVGAFTISSYLLTKQYYLYATSDSFSIILMSQILSESGLQLWTLNQFTEWGLIAPVFQMASSLLGEGYISGYQTLLAGSLLIVFSISIYQAFSRHFKPSLSYLFTGLSVLIITTIIFVEHAVYIHTNLTAAVYLYVALFAYWNFLQDDKPEWIILGTAAMIGVGFSRIEGPLYVILFLALAITSKQLKYKHALWIVLPYTILSIIWNTYLLFSVDQTGLLSQTNIIIIILSLLGLAAFGILSKWLPKITSFQFLILGLLTVGTVAAFLLKPDHMSLSLIHVIQNLVSRNAWGFTWFLILLLLPLTLDFNKDSPENRFLIFSITCYLILVVLFAFPREPYRLGKTDSANRMLLQIQPIIFLYISINSYKIKKWLLPFTEAEK